MAVGKERLAARAVLNGRLLDEILNDGKSRFSGESSVESGEERSHVGERTSGITRVLSRAATFNFVGDGGGVKKGLSISRLRFANNKRLRFL